MNGYGKLFGAPMVRALLAGRKTQTRRLLCTEDKKGRVRLSDWLKLRPGDQIWVRETHFVDPNEGVFYRATDPGWDENGTGVKWTPAIFMPRTASRITLTVTNIPRIERLQDISEEDALAEGIVACAGAMKGIFAADGCYHAMAASARDAYAILWNDINGNGAWVRNPNVVAINFTVRKGNIDKDSDNGG